MKFCEPSWLRLQWLESGRLVSLFLFSHGALQDVARQLSRKWIQHVVYLPLEMPSSSSSASSSTEPTLSPNSPESAFHAAWRVPFLLKRLLDSNLTCIHR